MWITVYDKFKRKLKATKVPDRDKLHFLIQAYHPIQHLLVGVVHSPSTPQSPLDVNVNFESRLYPIGAGILIHNIDFLVCTTKLNLIFIFSIQKNKLKIGMKPFQN